MANEVRIEIIAKDGASTVFKAVQESAGSSLGGISSSGQKMGADLNSTFDGILSHWKGIISGIAAYKSVSALGDLIKDSTMLSTRVETLDIVMQTVGRNMGKSAGEMRDFSEGVADMGITTRESEQSVIRLAQAHLDLSKASQLARVAQDAAVIGDVNSSEAMGRLIHGITTLQPEILRTIGITVNFEQEYANFANATGRAADSLSQQQKQQIALNAVLREGQSIAGTYEAAMGTVGKQMSSMPRLIEEAKLALGELFKPLWGEIMGDLYEKLKSFSEKLKEMKEDGSLAEWGLTAIPVIKSVAVELGVIAATLTTIAGLKAASSLASWMGLVKGGGLGAGGIAALGVGAAMAGAELGYWSTGQYVAEKNYNLQLKETSDWNKEQKEFMADLIAKRKTNNDLIVQQATATRQAKDEFTKWAQTIEAMNPDISETDKQVMKLWNDAQKFKAAGLPEGQVKETLNKGLEFINAANLNEFNKMIQNLQTARQKANDETSLGLGNFFTLPKGNLAEVDTWLKEMSDKYRQAGEQNSETMAALQTEAEEKRYTILSDWAVKRIEKEKETAEKSVEYLQQWLDYYRQGYDEATTRVQAYGQLAENIFKSVADNQKWIDDIGKAPKSQADQMKEAQDIVNESIRTAHLTNNPEDIQSALDGIKNLISQFGGLKNMLGGSELFLPNLKNEAEDLNRQLNLVGMSAQQAQPAAITFANQWAEAMKNVQVQIDVFQNQIFSLAEQITQVHALQIDTSQADTAIDALAQKMEWLRTLFAVPINLGINESTGGGSGSIYDKNGNLLNGGLSDTRPDKGITISYAGDQTAVVEPPVLAGGTPYVRRAGYAWIDRGEGVLTAQENRAYGKGDIHVIMGDIQVYGTNDPMQIARQIVVPLQAEMRRLNLMR